MDMIYFRLYLSQNAQVKKKDLLLKQLILIIKGVEERMLHNQVVRNSSEMKRIIWRNSLFLLCSEIKMITTPNEQEPWVSNLKIKA